MSAEDPLNELQQRGRRLAQELLEAMQRPGVDPERAAYEAEKERADRDALEDYYRRTGQRPGYEPGAFSSEAPLPLRSFGFEAVHGLWGGQALWATSDRSGVIQIVAPDQWEKRYRIRLSEAEWAEVERLAGFHRLLTLPSSERCGVPDETRVTLFAVTQSGQSARASRWANDAHPDFDAVYAYLVGLCRSEGEPVREGPYEPLQPARE